MLRFAFLASLLVASPVLAQVPDVADALDDDGLEEGHHLPDRSSANTVTHTGLSLTVSGLTTAALGTSLFWADGTGISGGTFAGLGLLLMMIGMPQWIVGGIRREVLNARPEDRLRVGNDYETAGIVTTFAALAVSLVGLVLLVIPFRSADPPELSRWIAGIALIPTGAGIATFIGIPMWSEAARF